MSDPLPGGSLPGEHSRLYRIGVMLLNGYGYNWYRRENQMRADDLLIRSRASEHLEKAAVRLRDLESRYRRKYLLPPTRERPDPEPQAVAGARRFRVLMERVLEIDTGLRGAAVPPEDKIWQRHRSELDALERLTQCDAILVAGAKELDDLITRVPADAALDSETEQNIDRYLGELAAVLTQRAELLAIRP
ncbi:MAG: hypothetical protein JO081_00725 [Alphaproteobacteria bacterium]|nr:hypothetical protein [Alphaproteobacteria bacterium]